MRTSATPPFSASTPTESENTPAEPLPSWFRPFTQLPNVRFTRTPDNLIGRTSAEDMDAAPVSAPIEPPSVDTYSIGYPGVRAMPLQETTRAPVATAVTPTPPDANSSRQFQPQSGPQGSARQAGEPLSAPAARAPERTPVPQPRVRTHAVIRPGSPAGHAPAPVQTGQPAGVRPALAARPTRLVAGSPQPSPELSRAPAVVPIVDETGLLSLSGWSTIAVRATFAWPSEEIAPASTARSVETAELHPAGDVSSDDYEFPSLSLLAVPPVMEPGSDLSAEALDKNSLLLQQTLHDFGVRGEIIDASPGPVVTLYELEPAPGTKSSRVISLSGDIARSMSAVSARVAVVEGRNVIGIELPNQKRETVWLRELLASQDFAASRGKLSLCLGKTIGGEAVIADLARMPHLLVAGTTGSGKSVAINTMILSLLYRHKPTECRLIMIDPKMLELSVYEGIPHLLTPVVTDPRKAVVALKWAVREMEERYKKMSRLGVRNIDGYNERVAEAAARGEVITRQVQNGFDSGSGEILYDDEIMDLTPLPYIVVIVDEMADLMMVAGKDIEGAIQRLAQMARAAGIHLIMATQRPSVDVITGTIKANFPTRISFQVTSKIDSRTILGEMGAEQLLGQGDMLFMAGGGRIQRVHGPFVADHEVEKVVQHLKTQGRPEYLEAVTDSGETAPRPADDDANSPPIMTVGDEEGGGDIYDQAVAVVVRDRKASTSYVQRRLQIGYNRAASIMERMEQEGIVGPANHAGKREIYVGSDADF